MLNGQTVYIERDNVLTVRVKLDPGDGTGDAFLDLVAAGITRAVLVMVRKDPNADTDNDYGLPGSNAETVTADSADDATLLAWGSPTLTGELRCKLGGLFAARHAESVWDAYLSLYDSTNTNGIRHDEPFPIRVTL